PQDPAWQDAWRMTEGTMTLISEEVKSKGARFFAVTVSSAAQVIPDVQIREKLLRNAGLKDLSYPDQRIKALGEREGFPVLNLAPMLATYASEHKVFLHGFGDKLGSGHWNQVGHRETGELIGRWLCDRLVQQQ